MVRNWQQSGVLKISRSCLNRPERASITNCRGRWRPTERFRSDNVPPGEYRLRINYPQPNIYVREAFLNSVDVLHQPLVVSNTPPGTLEITFSSKAAQVDGNVLNEQSQPIAGIQAVLIPDRFRDRSGVYKTAVTDPNGHFVFRSVAPGEYK